jgi:hypothetical protein
VLLLVLASDRVLVTEDKVNLRARACQIRTKHDHPGGLVIKVLARGLETILEELDVATTAVAALLVLDLVLDDKGLGAKVDRIREGSGDRVVGRLGLGDKALVAFNDNGLAILDRPFADVSESFTANGGLLGSLRDSPTAGPVVGELLDEGCVDSGRLSLTYEIINPTTASRSSCTYLEHGLDLVSSNAGDNGKQGQG